MGLWEEPFFNLRSFQESKELLTEICDKYAIELQIKCLLNDGWIFVVDKLSCHDFKFVVNLITGFKVSDILFESNVIDSIIDNFKSECSLHFHQFIYFLVNINLVLLI